MIEDSFYRPRKGDIIIEDFITQYEYEDDEGKYYQKSPKYESQVSVASSHGRLKGPEYPYKSRPVLLGMFISISNLEHNNKYLNLAVCCLLVFSSCLMNKFIRYDNFPSCNNNFSIHQRGQTGGGGGGGGAEEISFILPN